MSRVTVRCAAALAVLGAAVACTPEASVTLPDARGSIFESYVAIGNSITAGYVSSGINATTQQAAYPVLLARQMRTRFAIPLLANPGCPPPIVNFQTGSRGNAAFTATTCALRTGFTDVINNVAVPDAAAIDPTAEAGTPRSNVLTQLFLGGTSQVQRALQADPTFATVWIGNNDILAAAGSGVLVPAPGISPGATPLPAFTTQFTALMTQLTEGAPGIKGVAVGVVNVRNTPLVFPAAALLNPQFLGSLSAATGRTVTLHPNCTAASTSLISFAIVPAIRNGTHPPMIACAVDPATGLGQVFVLDNAEQTALDQIIAGYNAVIQQEAADAGWAYLDPNTTLAQLRATGCIATVPNLGSTTPFGACIGLDPVHPSAVGQRHIASALIGVINAKYGTDLQPIT